MRKFFAVAFLLIVISCNNEAKNTSETGTDTVETEYPVSQIDFEKTFPALTGFIRSEDSTFQPYTFSNPDEMELDSFTPHKTNRGFFEEYGQYLLYNADSSLALDLVSYNFVIDKKDGQEQLKFAGPDTEIGLITIKDSSRKRMLFLGASGMVLDGKWDTQGNIILAGGQDAGDERFQPLVWKIYPGNNRMEVMQYPGTIKVNLENFFKEKYKPVSKTSPAV
jgi:hypothetical protein